jgi:hypothetical protein
VKDENGGVTITLSKTNPGKGKNWLPHALVELPIGEGRRDSNEWPSEYYWYAVVGCGF